MLGSEGASELESDGWAHLHVKLPVALTGLVLGKEDKREGSESGSS